MANQNLYGDSTGKRHRDRKNSSAAEAWRKEKHERNAARGKQYWDLQIDLMAAPGRWQRISVA
jgi:hypothetical protein